MPDAVQPATLPAPTEIPLANYAPSIVIAGKRGERFEVAVNAVANRADAQIIVSKLKRLLEKTVQAYLEPDAPAPDPLTLSRLMTSAEAVVNMSISAYENKTPKDGGGGMAEYAKGLIEAAAKGLSAGVHTAADKRAEKMAALGRAKAASTEIEAKNVTPAP